MGEVRNIVNDQLLRLSYKDPKNIKKFLRSWGGLESLSLKGDTVATCILCDLKIVTGIDIDKYKRKDRRAFNLGYLDGKLSQYQYMAIAYTLVLGYSQEEIEDAKNMGGNALNSQTTDVKTRYRILMNNLIAKASKQIAEGKLVIKNVQDLERVVKLDLLLMGEATESTSNTSTTELSKADKDRLDNIAKLLGGK